MGCDLMPKTGGLMIESEFLRNVFCRHERPEKSRLIVVMLLFFSGMNASAEEWMHWQGANKDQLVIVSTDPLEDFEVRVIEGPWEGTPRCFPWESGDGHAFPGVAWLKGSQLLELRALERPTITGTQSLPVVSSLYCRFTEPIGNIEALRVSDLLGTGRPQVHLVRRDERERLEYLMLVQRKEERGWTLETHRRKYLGAGLGQMRAFWVTSENGELFLHLWGSQKALVYGLREGWKKELLIEGDKGEIPKVGQPMGMGAIPKGVSNEIRKKGWLGKFRKESREDGIIIQWCRFDLDGDLVISLDPEIIRKESFLEFSFADGRTSEPVTKRVNLTRRRGAANLVNLSSERFRTWERGKLLVVIKNSEGHLLDQRIIGKRDILFASRHDHSHVRARELEEIWKRKVRGRDGEAGLRYVGPSSDRRERSVALLNLSKVSSWEDFVVEFQASQDDHKWVWSWFSPEAVTFLGERELFSRREETLLKRRAGEKQEKGEGVGEFELVVRGPSGKPLEHHPVQFGVLGTAFNWKGLSGNGGKVDFPKNLLSSWATAASRSPLYLKAQLKDQKLECGVEIEGPHYSDVALSAFEMDEVMGTGVARLDSASLPTEMGVNSRLTCSSQGKVPLAWFENDSEASLISVSSGGRLGIHSKRRGKAPILVAGRLEDKSFLEVHRVTGGLELRFTKWSVGSDSFWKEEILGRRKLESLPRSILLLSERGNFRPIVSDDSGITLYGPELKAIQSWKRRGMEQLDLTPRGDDGFWLLDRRSNRQSWLYGMKIISNRIEVEGVVGEPLQVGHSSSSGGMVWDRASKVLWVLDPTRGKLCSYDVDRWSLVDREEGSIGEEGMKAFLSGSNSTLHILGNQPSLWSSVGLKNLKPLP
jgi:hypothetical protein